MTKYYHLLVEVVVVRHHVFRVCKQTDHKPHRQSMQGVQGLLKRIPGSAPDPFGVVAGQAVRRQDDADALPPRAQVGRFLADAVLNLVDVLREGGLAARTRKADSSPGCLNLLPEHFRVRT